ncbi:MAG: tetratricopeptide repeat protein [Flavobacteriales bacterium]|nr:tetratricopeptide repeat protein [Flavobacteriales bacterium]
MDPMQQAREYFEAQAFQKAIDLLNQFLSDNPENADALYLRGICHRRLGAFELSIADFTTMLIRLPDEPTILSERGVSYYHNNNLTAALKDMDRAVALEPENSYRYSSRAYIKAKVDVNGAMEDYKKAVELDPEDAIALNNLGLLEESAGKLSSAKKHFDRSNQIIGYNPDKRNAGRKKAIEPEKKETLGKVMLDVFRDKETRKDYFKFLKNILKKKR